MVGRIRWTKTWRRAAPVVAIGATGVLVAGCGDVDLSSTWRDREVSIDGENTEWQAALTHFEDQGVSVGVMNDEEYVYLSLFVGDRVKQAQMMALGCTVWFDPTGGDERTLGIHYPLGSPGKERELLRSVGPNPDSETLKKMFAEVPREFELLGAGPGRRMPLGEGDVQVAAKLYGSSLIYELKIPLAAGVNHVHAIGTEPGKKFAVTLVTPEIEHPEAEQVARSGGGTRGGGGESGGGRRAGGGRGGRGGGRSSGGSRPAPLEPLNVKATVQLEKSATSG